MSKQKQTPRQRQLEQWFETLRDSATPTLEECIGYLGEHFDWLYRLRTTRQDPQWHGEGDVYIHTERVLSALYRLLETEAGHVTGAQRLELILAAALHDIAKCVCTREVEIRGRRCVTARNHEIAGRSYLAHRIMALGLPYSSVWSILGLVGEHQRPKLLVVKNCAKHDYLALSRKADAELLYWLERADMLGRSCPDQAQQLELLEQFRMFCEEYGVWGASYRLPPPFLGAMAAEPPGARRYLYAHTLRAMERGELFSPEEGLARFFGKKEQHAHLVIMCGLSGSGKSRCIERRLQGFRVISLDQIREELTGQRANQKINRRVVQLARERLKQALRAGEQVVWDATSIRSDFRTQLRDLALQYGALVTIVLVHRALAAVQHGNRNRCHAVPESVLARQLEHFQWPTLDEAHQFVVVGEDAVELYSSGSGPQPLAHSLW